MTDDTATDGETANGAIDNSFDEFEKSYEDQLADALDDVATEPMAGGLAFDLVTRQPLFVRRVVAESLGEYYESEGFDLATYKAHPYLPVRPDDPVYECVFVSEITADGLNGWDSSKTYDYPRGRLAHVPIEQSWSDGDVGEL